MLGAPDLSCTMRLRLSSNVPASRPVVIVFQHSVMRENRPREQFAVARRMAAITALRGPVAGKLVIQAAG